MINCVVKHQQELTDILLKGTFITFQRIANEMYYLECYFGNSGVILESVRHIRVNRNTLL